jgi:hypothetical protein
MAAMAAAFAAGGLLAQGGIGPIGNLQGKVDANNALVIKASAAGSVGTAASAIANLPGKVDANNALVVAMSGSQTLTGPLLLGDGTVGAPSYSFASDPTTGIFRPSTSTIVFSTGGTARAAVEFGALGLTSSTQLGWEAGTVGTGTLDTILIRDAANTLALRNAAAVQTLRIGPTTSYASILSSSTITPAVSVAAGGTVNTFGEHTRGRYQITIAPATGDCSAAFILGATTADCTIATLPAGMRLVGAFADVTVGFTCSGTCTGTKVMQCGISGAGTEILAAAFNVATTGQAGDADAEMGGSMTRAAQIQGGYLPSWSGTTPVVCRFTSGTGNWGSGAATFVNAGSVKITLTTELIK